MPAFVQFSRNLSSFAGYGGACTYALRCIGFLDTIARCPGLGPRNALFMKDAGWGLDLPVETVVCVG